MIWLAQLELLDRLGAEIVWKASRTSYDPDRLRRLLPSDGVIVLGGGGNLGDRYRGQHEVRERVLVDLRDRRVVQLPQSMWFVDENRRRQFADLCSAHPDLHLLWRDPVSARLGRRYLPARSHRLCPDVAFAANCEKRERRRLDGPLWLLRRDAERRSADLRPPSVVVPERVVDWPDLLADPVVESGGWFDVNRSLTAEFQRRGSLSDAADAELTATFEPFAKHYLDQATGPLAAAEVVVTDRLHGHVLAFLEGTPTVVLDNLDGKVHALAGQWTGRHRSVRRVGDPVEAQAAVATLGRAWGARER